MPTKCFESTDELLDHLSAVHTAAQASTAEPEHRALLEQLTPGAYFICRPEYGPHGIRVYGRVFDIDHDSTLTDPEEIEDDRRAIASTRENGYLFCKAFSVMCEDGELGDIHVSRIELLLTEEEFESARAGGWR